ncbi:MAG: proline--tRNA ligase [Desulfurococcaceae archaeon]|nr:proline--tRNA ligase [Sulfolobales archaeon]MDW8170055.1 proline--tRNA ligase [Desulfurococcaceae archaeon]
MSSIKPIFDVDKFANFAEWYQEILWVSDLIDVRYPAKGMVVWKPYGLKALRLMQRVMIELLEETGHQEAYFPTMIPESVFAKEKEFLEGFGGDTFVVEGTGTRRFNEKLYVRPTSETVMYYMWSMWVRGRKDLPIKMYQLVNVFRYETKATHPILRVREIVSFIEAHTAHATKEEAEKQMAEAVGIYKEFYDRLRIPYFIVKTAPWDTFSGAEYNYDFITAMPDGKGLELGSVINLGQRFSKAFDIKFMDEDGSYKYVYQTCYGISERSLGAVIAVHGDRRGLFFPPEVAPVQVVIVPIAKPEEEDILQYAHRVNKILREGGIRSFVDDDPEHTPGWKYYHWEMKGVPTRVEVGRREVESNTVTIARRDTLQKVVTPIERAVESLIHVWTEINDSLYLRALEQLKKLTTIVEDPSKAVNFRGLVITPWDESRECADKLETLSNRQVLGTIIESPLPLPEVRAGVCNSSMNKWALLGVTY